MLWELLATCALIGIPALLCLWALETAPVEPHGLGSFDVPPPIPVSGPIDRLIGAPADFED